MRLWLLATTLKVAGFRRGNERRRASRSKRWRKTAQTSFSALSCSCLISRLWSID